MTRPPKHQTSPSPLRHSGGSALPLAACGADRTVTGSTYSPDYRAASSDRARGGRSNPRRVRQCRGGLDPRQREDVVSFRDRVSALRPRAAHGAMPAGAGAELGAHRTLEAVRERARARRGSGRLPLGLDLSRRRSRRRVADPAVVPARSRPRSPASADSGRRISASATSSADLNNGPYWNLGCALQTTSPPRSPIRSISSAAARKAASTRCGASKDIENLRQGKDPSTQYRSDEKGKINSAGRQLTALREKAGEHV